jgi:hypothetical protein
MGATPECHHIYQRLGNRNRAALAKEVAAKRTRETAIVGASELDAGLRPDALRLQRVFNQGHLRDQVRAFNERFRPSPLAWKVS